MVISAVEDGERMGWRQEKRSPDMTLWSVSSFTAKRELTPIPYWRMYTTADVLMQSYFVRSSKDGFEVTSLFRVSESEGVGVVKKNIEMGCKRRETRHAFDVCKLQPRVKWDVG